MNTCTRCGAISEGSFCIYCDAKNCESCDGENTFITGNTQECAICHAYWRREEHCTCCSKKEGFEIHDGKAYQKVTPTIIGAEPQFIPLWCGTCNSTGLIYKRIGDGIAPDRKEEMTTMVNSLRLANMTKRTTEAFQRRRREEARQEKERKAKDELLQKQREDAKKREDKRQARYRECQVEIDAINEQLQLLQTQGSDATKARFTQNKNRNGTNRQRFHSLCSHYQLGKLDGSQPNAGAKEMEKKANALSLSLFEVWLQDLRKKEIERLKQHFNCYLSHYSPRDDHKPNSQMNKLAKIYLASSLPSNYYGFTPFFDGSNFLPFSQPYADYRAPSQKDKFDLSDYLTLTFDDVYKIRNAVWRKSFRYSLFGGEPAPIYSEQTKERDIKFRELQLKQIAFLNSYYFDLSTRLTVPYSEQGCSPELQKKRIILQYYQTLNDRGYAYVFSNCMDHLDLDDILKKFTFEMKLDRPYERKKYEFNKTVNHYIPFLPLTRDMPKAVTLAQLDEAWQTYRKERQSRLFAKPPSKETLSAYVAALNPLLSEKSRYLILNDYAINERNQHRAFKKALDETFGYCYFNVYPNNSISVRLNPNHF